MIPAIRVVVLGAGGRMGRAVIRRLLDGAVPGLELAGAVDLWDCPDRGRDAGLAAGAREPAGVEIGCDLAAAAPRADVVIDFSGPAGTAGNASRCAEWGAALVIGTTGLLEEQQAEIERAARLVPVVQAPNMSLGINLLIELTRQVAGSLRGRGFDIEIIERHHRRKKDAPSGTALALGRAAAEGAGWPPREGAARHGRHGIQNGDRPGQQIGYHAVRAGDLPGDHTVLFASEGECVELSHRATSRDAFAIGALRAASWVKGRPPGRYSMRDVLELGSGGA